MATLLHVHVYLSIDAYWALTAVRAEVVIIESGYAIISLCKGCYMGSLYLPEWPSLSKVKSECVYSLCYCYWIRGER